MTLLPILKTLAGAMFGRRVTVKYPNSEKKTFSATRGHIENDIESCIFCGLCQKQCPTGAITVARADKTWAIARYDCCQCGRCAEVCPKKCLNMSRTPPEAVLKQEHFTMQQPEKPAEGAC